MNSNEKPKFMYSRWDIEQKNLLSQLWNDGKSYEDIAIAVNELIGRIANARGFDIHPVRTANAVAIQCEKFGFITKRKLIKWQKLQTKSRQSARRNNLFRAKKEVQSRDDHKCVICGNDNKLVFAHIIPFIETRQNTVIEAVTLCFHHHKHFDERCIRCVNKIFEYMLKKHSGYQDKYEIENLSPCRSRIVQKVS